MQIMTHWQPAYNPPGFNRVEYVEEADKVRTPQRILAYLTEHGPTARSVIVEKLCITNSVFRHAVEEFVDEVEFEQSGSAASRISMYWLRGHPPAPEKRCASHKVYEWLRANPWKSSADIPDSVYTAKNKHGAVNFLEKQNRLISRKISGVSKQYRVNE